MSALFLAGCVVLGAVGGSGVDAWIRAVAAREARQNAFRAGTGTGPNPGTDVRPGVPLDQHLTAGGAWPLVVPALSALGCLLAGIRFGPALVVVPFLFFVPLLAELAVVDLHTHRLPNALTLPSYLVGLVLVGGTAAARGEPAVLARAVAAAVLLFVVFLTLALLRPAGMGMGDVKAAGVIGLFVGSLGIGAALVAAFLAALLALVGGFVLMAAGRIGRRTPTPFGPWLALGALTAMLAGPALFAAYLGSMT